MAFGLMGGDMQPQGHAQIIVNLVDFGMNLQEAGDAIRFHHTGSSEPTGTVMTDGGILHIEDGLPAAVIEELELRGHVIKSESARRLRRLPGDLARSRDRRLLRRDGEAQGRLRAGVLSASLIRFDRVATPWVAGGDGDTPRDPRSLRHPVLALAH